MSDRPADICLILEGTYPYISGGVSSWTHDLIRAQKDLTFALVSLVADPAPSSQAFELPPNVVDWRTVSVGSLPEGKTKFSGSRDLPMLLAPALSIYLQQGRISEFKSLLKILAPVRGRAGTHSLLNSPEAWQTLTSMYEGGFKATSFIDYFWTWRALLTGFYSILLAQLPEARVYHAISTGYAGLLAARASVETGRPSVITEHGIYTNERRIEIALAEWLHDPGTLSLGDESESGGLKALWTNAFSAYSRTAYEAASRITTLYRGNQEMQRRDGAPPQKLAIIPNGIDVARFSKIQRSTRSRRPCVALIGRVVPIKDVKTYIRAVRILADSVPDIDALVLGPDDEDIVYAGECKAMVQQLGLAKNLTFTGRVKLDEFLHRIDLNVLTSVSEAQPLVVLEAGAAGIPTVSTDVGCCRELLSGIAGEEPAFGEGGIITPLSNPTAIAAAMLSLLSHPKRLEAAGQAMKRRVNLFYNKLVIDKKYRQLYDEAATHNSRLEAA
ncbi:MAG: GT4 family glycosyltransferase PelF [Micropepsaceae bacterium]